MNWAYGVTTVPSRKRELLPRTLESLKRGGFSEPRLFIDGLKDGSDYDSFGLEVTTRFPGVNTVNNWVLTLWELYTRSPNADRYAIFQDDFVTYLNLREYLTQCEYPKQGYWNLYSFPKNERIANGKKGWYPSNQLGRGAVALVFDHEAATNLLNSQYLIKKLQNLQKSPKGIDGIIIESMKIVGWKEYVHMPSLVQHTGKMSSIDEKHNSQKLSTSFRGESFDAMELLI